MKICVLGLDCAAPEILFGSRRLVNIRRLMARSVWGRLESVIPPITVPAWMCLATSQDPGSLGVYGFHNRPNHTYTALTVADSNSIKAPAIWDHLASESRRSIIVGVPPNYPPRKVNGISVGCFLTPDTTKDEFTFPANIKDEINALVGDYPVDVPGFRTDNKAWLKEQIFDMSRKQWKVVHWLLREKEWDYFHFVDIGLDRVQHGFWDSYDERHIHYQPGNPFESVIPDYYQWLDEQIGLALELLPADTIVLVVSDHGAQRLDGGFAVNEWLMREGLLILDEPVPRQVTRFAKIKVNWGKTRAWSEGGYYARVFFNMEGREPRGIIPASQYGAFQQEMKERFAALTGRDGQLLNSQIYKPNEIYSAVRNVAPDLIILFGGLYWRSIGSLGHGRLLLEENDTGPDGCNHAQYGSFILASPTSSRRGEYCGARLLDMAPTLLRLAGYDVPASMQGRALFTLPD